MAAVMAGASTGTLRSSPSCERNSDAIGAVLADWLQQRRRMLEIGSGTGQHASALADRLPSVEWQTSDKQPDVTTIAGWAARSAAQQQITGPVFLDVTNASQWQAVAGFDACFTANTLHIMSWQSVQQMFLQASMHAADNCVWVIYGPFHEDGNPTSDGNARFDVSLRAESGDMGIRDIAAVRAEAAKTHWLERAHYHMPANNQALVLSLKRGHVA